MATQLVGECLHFTPKTNETHLSNFVQVEGCTNFLTVLQVVLIAEEKKTIDNLMKTGKGAYKCIDDAIKGKSYPKNNL